MVTLRALTNRWLEVERQGAERYTNVVHVTQARSQIVRSPNLQRDSEGSASGRINLILRYKLASRRFRHEFDYCTRVTHNCIDAIIVGRKKMTIARDEH